MRMVTKLIINGTGQMSGVSPDKLMMAILPSTCLCVLTSFLFMLGKHFGECFRFDKNS